MIRGRFKEEVRDNHLVIIHFLDCDGTVIVNHVHCYHYVTPTTVVFDVDTGKQVDGSSDCYHFLPSHQRLPVPVIHGNTSIKE